MPQYKVPPAQPSLGENTLSALLRLVAPHTYEYMNMPARPSRGQRFDAAMRRGAPGKVPSPNPSLIPEAAIGPVVDAAMLGVGPGAKAGGLAKAAVAALGLKAAKAGARVAGRTARTAAAPRLITGIAHLPAELTRKEFLKESAKVLKGIRAGEKGAGPLDLSGQSMIPQVRQVALERYVPPRGVPARTQDALVNPDVIRGVRESVDRGVAMGADKWYHTQPVLDAFIRELGPELGTKRFGQFMDMVAASSPRSTVPENIRNASYYYHLLTKQSDLGGKNPYPYGHMAQKEHRKNFLRLTSSGTVDPNSPEATRSMWNILQNPKPASFSQNLQGNLAPGTMDTHAFRNIGMRTHDPRFLETMTSQKYNPKKPPPGPETVAARFGEFNPEKSTIYFRPQQLLASGRLTMDEAQKLPGFWAAQPKKTEYGAVENFYRDIAKERNMPLADVQAAAWSGAGEMTGLGTVPTHTFPEMLNERVLYTSKMRGESAKKTLSDFITGKKPLLGLAGAGVVAPAVLPRRQSRSPGHQS